MKIDELPSQYKPYGKISLGTNVIENVTAILTVKGHVPLLIGQGEPPKIWLYVPTDSFGTEWYPLIKDNFSSHPDVKVIAEKKLVTIKTSSTTVLTCLVGDNNVINILKLDLSPFGLDVYSDEKSLKVMGNTLSNNTFKSLKVVIGID